MKEISDILKAYKKAVKAQQKTALATVVKVEGSSYRRPGARMLITEDGQLTGAISGGCLEGDALRKALSAIVQQENKLITYDTTDEEDAKIGVQLGCNGIVHILFEPIKDQDPLNPIALLEALIAVREDAVIVTLFSLTEKNQPGSSMLYRAGNIKSRISGTLNKALIEGAGLALQQKTSSFKHDEQGASPIDVFFEFIRPAISLVIAGAGNDAQPLSEMAYLLGWEVMVVDGRPTHASSLRFPNATRVIIAKPEQVLSQINIDEQTAFVLMTHNYNYDLALLNILLDTNTPYIGSLGPKKKLIRMLDELDRNISVNQLRVHGPVGLDIGAETAEEIAISILAEIKAVFSGASASSLKAKSSPIHHQEKKIEL
ncbi:XdhC family protein [Pedobacter gandavensis]|uniref:XdhC/CoxI family protein n=1 Tax=Pedobacter gandavensis TaxID=2679963 RepID=A0ABR6ES11_9SPHI|nr:XdhC/CoxI family protein [Pedobacter gandavensis]MBB2148039.1 XdhC/CoxI family protein [Pedobacter gandavensis]